MAWQELLALPFFKKNNFGEADIEREVECNDKRRFSLWLEGGAKRLRANQGHKMKEAPSSRRQTVDKPSRPLRVEVE